MKATQEIFNHTNVPTDVSHVRPAAQSISGKGTAT